ncbi:MAG: hypothetical protein JWQ10_161 [Herbaspirillum sp.]|nr:hypothetical protein [Herbaspirillum sp.]
MPDSPSQIPSSAAAQTPHSILSADLARVGENALDSAQHAHRKQLLIAQGAVCRAQILNSSRAIRHGANIKVIADQAKHAAIEVLKDKFYRQRKKVQELMPVVLDRVLTMSSVSTRYIRKPVLYGAMILGAISALPRFFKERKRYDSQ